MPFFQKKQSFQVKLVQREAFLAAGLLVQTDERHFSAQLASLQEQFYKERSKIHDVLKPLQSLAISFPKDAQGKFEYFMGDCIAPCAQTQQEEGFHILSLPASSFAVITVDYRSAVSYPLDVARAHQFFDAWLASSQEYEAGNLFQEMQLFDRRSRIALASMDLYFSISIKEKSL